MPGFPVHRQFPGPTQIHFDCISDAIEPSHPLLTPFPPLRDLPNPGVKPASFMPLALTSRFFVTSATWEAYGKPI